MTLQELFDELLSARSVTVVLNTSQSNSLRVQLIKKWKFYKESMESCGFLSAELAACYISRKAGDGNSHWTFLLAEKQRTAISYQLLQQTEEVNCENV
jgi:hypothetical protein